MQTIQPTLKRGRDVWDAVNMPMGEFQERVRRIREEMRARSIALLLLYGNGADNYGNPCYVSNFLIKMPRGAMVVVPSDGEPTLIVDGFPRDQPAVESTTWIKDVRSCRDIAQECVKYLEEGASAPSTIGFAGLRDAMPYAQFRSLSQSLAKYRIVDAETILRHMRTVKSERERDQVRRASLIVKRVFDFVTGCLRKFDPERDPNRPRNVWRLRSRIWSYLNTTGSRT